MSQCLLAAHMQLLLARTQGSQTGLSSCSLCEGKRVSSLYKMEKNSSSKHYQKYTFCSHGTLWI